MLQRQVEIKKVVGEENPADLMTKHVPEVKCARYTESMALRFAQGRAKVGLKVQHGSSKDNDTQVV